MLRASRVCLRIAFNGLQICAKVFFNGSRIDLQEAGEETDHGIRNTLKRRFSRQPVKKVTVATLQRLGEIWLQKGCTGNVPASDGEPLVGESDFNQSVGRDPLVFQSPSKQYTGQAVAGVHAEGTGLPVA